MSTEKVSLGTRTRSREEVLPIIYALGYFSGWSAERISLTLKSTCNVDIDSMDIWHIYKDWTHANGDLGPAEIIDLKETFKMGHKRMRKHPRSLADTPIPVSNLVVKFVEKWDNKDVHGGSLCENYSRNTQEYVKDYLMSQPLYMDVLDKLTAFEKAPIEQLGGVVVGLVKKHIISWVADLKRHLQGIPFWRKVLYSAHKKTISDRLVLFKKDWEAVYGKMAGYGSMTQKESNAKIFVVRSVAQGTMILLGLMLSDRSYVVDRRRDWYQKDSAFTTIPYNELEPDSKACAICMADFQEAAPEDGEEPIRLVQCCGAVLGKACLREWTTKGGKEGKGIRSCPNCREHLGIHFMQKLLNEMPEMETEDDYDEELSSDEEEPVAVHDADGEAEQGI